ncbi:MAG: hypothetical protein HW420_544 [Candidatus Nitrosotenuis sp.]|jgi:hypothetical protein|nr:hypothetical protein [Candidatus Nitrosotenuis sp.]
MSRWDEPDRFDDEEESRLLKKFYNYVEIEKKETERRKFLEVSDKKRPCIWGNRFVLSAIIQGSIITGLTVALILIQAIFADVSLIQFLSLSLDGSAKWFFFGYFMYITLVVAIAITAIFYNHLETNLNRQVRGNKKYLAWVQFIGMNVGGAATTILMMLAGLAGTGFVDFAIGNETVSSEIMDVAELPITGFALVFAAGIIAGGIAYIGTYMQGPKSSKLSFAGDSRKYDRL